MRNIGGDKSDKSYRYKMPILQAKVEGRGNGIKTVIVNMVEIAKALHVDPAYPTKFFGFELGAQSKFNTEDERAIVNGAHTAQDLSNLLDKFIEIFVLCPNCKLPEIKIQAKSGLKIHCAACPFSGNLDTQHKLKQYIIKNPPAKKKGEAKDKDKKDKKDKESSKEAKGPVLAVSRKAVKEREEEWQTDVSEAAQEKRKAELMEEHILDEKKLEKVKQIQEAAKRDNKTDSPVTALKIFLAERDRDVPSIKSEVKRLQISRDLDSTQRLKMLLEALFDLNPDTIVAQIGQYAELLKQYANDRNSGLLMLGCLEELIGVIEPKLLPKTSHILEALYNKDVLSEDTLLAWHDSPPEASFMVPKKVAEDIRVKADKFITWLKEAEEEE